MKVYDLDLLRDDEKLEVDLCIVGSGPAGLSIATELANLNIRVLLLEGGGLDEEPEYQTLYDIESIGRPRQIDQSIIRSRGFGGTSRIWTGRCAPFDALDFEPRPWISRSGWPFARTDFEPYLERAAEKLGLAPARYDESLWSEFRVSRPSPPLDERLLKPMFWQFSRSPRNQQGSIDVGLDLTHARPNNVQVLLHANVTQINTSPDGGRFESVEIRSLRGRAATVHSKVLVLCAGGIENARLLLSSNRTFVDGLGNQNDLVGRFLMDHTDAKIWDLDQTSAQKLLSRFGTYWLDKGRDRHVFLHGAGLSPEIQAKEQLLNCHAYIEQFGFAADDPWLAARRLIPAVRSRKWSRSGAEDARLVFKGLGELSKGFYRRAFAHRPQRLRADRFELRFILEQAPDPASRITLSSKKDALGMPTVKIDWKISDLERQTAKRMGQLLHEEFGRLKLPALQAPAWLDDLNEWVSRCSEKAHPTGATRMSISPKEGVVNENCQVHGVEGLYVSGSSVFPTSGAANPTLMIVAISIRLADWLKTNSFAALAYAGKREYPALSSVYQGTRHGGHQSDTIKIGFVGTGQRIRDIYLPILKKMQSKYQIVGFTSGSAHGSRKFESQTGIEAFANPRDLVSGTHPDFLLVAVPDQRCEGIVNSLLHLAVPLLVETPLAWSAAGVRRIIARAAEKNICIGVAEQFPFLPLEQFRRKLLDTGVLGRIYAAFNEFNSYSYHGIAQLRRYLKGVPVEVSNADFHFANDLRWQSGSVMFSDGGRLEHNYHIVGRSHDPSVHIHGTAGSMRDELITVVEGSLVQQKIALLRQHDSLGRLTSISANMPNIGQVQWDNKFATFGFSEEQVAVATLLEGMSLAVREGHSPCYTAADFLTDIEIVQAFRYGAAHGQPIRLPLRENVQKVLSMKGRLLKKLR